jgi:hypothetical protein
MFICGEEIYGIQVHGGGPVSMMWMIDIQGFRHVTLSIAYFLYLSLPYYPIFAAVPWRRQSPFSQQSEFDPRPDNN